MVHKVFISYSARDREIAECVCEFLEKRGVQCWIAPRNIIHGIPFSEAIIDAIAAARAFILIFSENSNQSDHVMREVERAVHRHLPIITFRVDSVEPSSRLEYFIALPHWLDAARPPQESHFEQLARSVQYHLSETPDVVAQKTLTEPSTQVKLEGKPFIWSHQDNSRSSFWLKIFRIASNTYRFSLIDQQRRKTIFDKIVVIDKLFHKVIARALEDSFNQPSDNRQVKLARLGNLLYRSLLPIEIQDTIDRHENFDIILGSDDLNLPWEVLHDEKDFLSLQRQFTRIPESLNWLDVLTDGVQKSVLSESIPGALLIADPEGNLSGTEQEIRRLRQLFEEHGFDCEVLIGPIQCTYLSVIEKLRQCKYGLVHVIANLQYLSNRGISALILSNEQLLTADEICAVFQGSPFIFLDGRQAPTDFANQFIQSWNDMPKSIQAMAQAFTCGGQSQFSSVFVGSLWRFHTNLPDSHFAEVFYRQLLAGATVGAALLGARQQATEWEDYVLFGDFHFGLCSPDTKSPKVDEPSTCKSSSAPGSSLHWSDEVRVALFGAIASMHAMNWSVLSTANLLLGLTYLPHGLLSSALAERGLDPHQARRDLRRLWQQKTAPVNINSPTMSDNVSAAFEAAKQIAFANGAKEIEEKHLLKAILDQHGSGAVRILQILEVEDSLQISLGYNDSLFQKNGDLNCELFEEDCLDGLKNAVEMAMLDNWSEIRTPHIFLGFLTRDRSIIAEQVRKLNLGVSLVDIFDQYLKKPALGIHRKLALQREFFSINAQRQLKKAYSQAKAAGYARIREIDLFKSILSEPDGFVVMLLKKNKIDIEKILHGYYSDH